MLADYHIHTALCKHAEGVVSEYKKQARLLNITEICFTDHVPAPDGYDPEHRMDIRQFDTYKSAVYELQNEKEPKVLFGIEADYYKGCEKFLREWLIIQNFDFILGSIHFIQDWGFDNPAKRHIWDAVDVTETWKKYFELVGELADTGLFDAVAHLDLPKKFNHRPSDKDLKEMAAPVLDRIAMAGMGIELNTSGLLKPVAEIYPCPLLLSLAFEREIPICFGSDAHAPEQVGQNFDLALKLARDIGYADYFRIRARKKERFPLP